MVVSQKVKDYFLQLTGYSLDEAKRDCSFEGQPRGLESIDAENTSLAESLSQQIVVK